jgi:hypothetical protein
LTLVAYTLKTYGVPFVNPGTIIGDEDAVAVTLPGLDIAVYPVIGEPPVSTGGVNDTEADCDAIYYTATTFVGAPGTPDGVTELDGADSGPLPTEFVACTVNVYEVPFVSPVTTIGDVAPLAVKPPGVLVTVYPVIGEPPVLAGAVKDTEAEFDAILYFLIRLNNIFI